MSDSYQPIIGSDEEYELAPTSTKNMEAFDTLKMRAPFVSDRDEIAETYGYEDAEEALSEMGEDTLAPPQFWEEASLIIFDGLDDIGEEGIDYSEARRAAGKFTFAGNEQYAELMSGLSGLLDTEKS